MKTKRKPNRKRTNSKVPAKGRLREMADTLWSLAVRSDWAWKCAVCGNSKVEAHHLTPRQFTATRFDLDCGIALCSHHHQFCPEVSPHQNAAGWLAWLEKTHPRCFAWYQQNKRPLFEGTTNSAYYCEVILALEPYVDDGEFERVCGIKFSRYLLEEFKSC